MMEARQGMQILTLGSYNIDMVYAVDRILRPGETISATQLAYYPGGKGLNQSIALARAGANVFPAGCIGADGNMLLQYMKDSGLDTKHIRTVDAKTGHAIIQVDQNAENAIMIYRGANACITREHIDSILSNFHAGDFIVTQNEVSNVPYLIHQAANRGLQVVFNPSPFHKDILEVDLKEVSYLILNEVEATDFWGTCDPREIQPMIEKVYPHLKVVLTLGKRGSVYMDHCQIHRQSAYKVTSVDTTGAGDTFAGYFIACICKGKSPKIALRYAAAASAIAVSQMGAASSIPWMKDVSAQLREMIPETDCIMEDMKNRIAQFFEIHYKDATLTTLSKELGYTPSYTSNWLRSITGATFTQMLQDAKCKAAARLLDDNTVPISEIIQIVGYKNESFFRRMFLQHYGCTPLKYRQKRSQGSAQAISLK